MASYLFKANPAKYQCMGHAVDNCLSLADKVQSWRKLRKNNVRLSMYGPLTRYVNMLVAHAPEMLGMFSRPPRLAIPTCVTARASKDILDLEFNVSIDGTMLDSLEKE